MKKLSFSLIFLFTAQSLWAANIVYEDLSLETPLARLPVGTHFYVDKNFDFESVGGIEIEDKNEIIINPEDSNTSCKLKGLERESNRLDAPQALNQTYSFLDKIGLRIGEHLTISCSFANQDLKNITLEDLKNHLGNFIQHIIRKKPAKNPFPSVDEFLSSFLKTVGNAELVVRKKLKGSETYPSCIWKTESYIFVSYYCTPNQEHKASKIIIFHESGLVLQTYAHIYNGNITNVEVEHYRDSIDLIIYQLAPWYLGWQNLFLSDVSNTQMVQIIEDFFSSYDIDKDAKYCLKVKNKVFESDQITCNDETIVSQEWISETLQFSSKGSENWYQMLNQIRNLQFSL